MKYQNMRNELVEYLKGLSNKQYQLDCWVNNQCPNDIEYDNFDLAVHFLFDDTACADNPEKLIGFFLKNQEEALAIKRVCIHIDKLLNKYGCNKNDFEYMQTPEWSDVLESSKIALEILTRNRR